MVDEWLSTFPYSYFGFTGNVGYYRGPGAHLKRLAVRSVPNDRLLIETDAPHLPVHPRREWHDETFIGDVGQAVAQIRGVSLESLLGETAANGRRLYCLRS